MNRAEELVLRALQARPWSSAPAILELLEDVGGNIWHSTCYRALERLEAREWVEVQKEAAAGCGRPALLYSVSAAGRKALRHESAVRIRLAQREVIL